MSKKARSNLEQQTPQIKRYLNSSYLQKKRHLRNDGQQEGGLLPILPIIASAIPVVTSVINSLLHKK